MRGLSTKEAARRLYLLPLMFGWSIAASAQFPLNATRAAPLGVISAGSSPSTKTNAPKKQQSLIFSEAVPRIVVQQSFQFAVAAVYDDGSQVRLTDAIWQSSSPEIATVGSSGMVVGLREGRTFISARSGRSEVRVRLSVLPKTAVSNPIVTVEITPSTPIVEAGTSLQFAASARTADGAVVPDAPVTYSSLDTTIARITDAGLFSGRKEGTVDVMATSGAVSDRVAVKVGRSRVASISVTPQPITATAADTVVLKVSAVRRDGTSVALSDLVPSARRGTFRGWTYVPPKEVGTDSITVASTDGVSAVVPVTVTAVAAPAPAPSEPAPVTPPPTDGSLPAFTAPTRPTSIVDVRVPAVTGRTIRVAAGDANGLKAALASAVGGDEILLPNGSTFTGNFILPVHSGSAPVTLRSETVGVVPGTRVTPSTASNFARIITPNVDAAIGTAAGAAAWRLIGLQVQQANMGTVLNYGIVRLGTGAEPSVDSLVRNIVLDRMYVSAGATNHTRRCVGFNGNALAVVNSWLADCHSKGFDTQGIGGWTGAGPFLIENNHIEGSGQGIMFGGADVRIANMTPSDITIRRNHIYKPMSWANGVWSVKAAFELKHAQRVLFESNVIENHWADAQTGFAILFQALSDNNTTPWTKVHDITVVNNIVRNSTGVLNLLSRVAYGTNGVMPTEPSKRILVQNNLFQNVGRDPATSANARVMQLLNDHEDVSIVQNTFTLSSGLPASAAIFDGNPSRRLLIANNVFPQSEYGVFGSGQGEGQQAITFFGAGTTTFRGNVVTARTERLYPTGNFFPASLSASSFTSDFTLIGTSTVPASSGGARIGIDGAALRAALSGVEQ